MDSFFVNENDIIDAVNEINNRDANNDWEYEIVDEPDEPVDTYEPTGTPVTLDFTKTEFTTASDNVSLSETEVTITHEGLNFVWTKADSSSNIALNDEKTALKLSAGFGGGMGRLREVCGAVSAMFMVLGMKYASDNPADHAQKAKL